MKKGADGVTAINTISGLMGVNTQGVAWPHVGAEQKTTYGGMSGNANRPVALKMVSAIGNAIPGYPILATGGIDSADVALQFIHCGASVVQICSSIQNQEFTVIEDYITGLKALLYLKSKEDTKHWEGQSAPRVKPLIEKIVSGQHLPRFGEFKEKRWELRDLYSKEHDLLETEKLKLSDVIQAHSRAPVDNVNSIRTEIGLALPRIGNYSSLNNGEQVVALVDEDLCINCGKCYMTCNDSGYQAIIFDGKTHLPFVTEDCTGCTLCASVCPIPDCISMVPRRSAYHPKRGIEPTDAKDPFDDSKVNVGWMPKTFD